MSLSELATQLYNIRERKNELTNTLKEVQGKLDQIESEMLEEMAQEGLNRVDVNGIGSFFIASRRFYKVANKEALLDFVYDQGDTDLLSIQHQTLNAYAKEIYARKEAEGIEDYVMPGVVFTSKAQIRVRKQ